MLVLMLDALPNFVIVGTAADGLEAVQAVLKSDPDAALLDVEMPRVYDKLELSRTIGRIAYAHLQRRVV